MAEEHSFQPAEGHRLCANNCGFFGSSATMNLCSKCYREMCHREEQKASIKSTVETSLSSSASSSSSSSPAVSTPISLPSIPVSLSSTPEIAIGSPSPAPESPATVAGETRSVQDCVVSVSNRCSVCRKRVGLTGFKCRCGTTFCGSHRYPEKHDCSFDFKRVGREEIARANPLVKAEKLDKI